MAQKSEGIVFDIKRYALHDGPGTRTTVFLKGCPLHCAWCHNPEGIPPQSNLTYRPQRCISCGDCLQICQHEALRMDEPGELQYDASKCHLCFECIIACPSGALEQTGKAYTPQELKEIILKDRVHFEQSGGGVTFSGGEPLLQVGFLREILSECKTEGLHCTLDTCGMAPWENIDLIREFVDLFLYDLKFVDDHMHKAYTGVSNQQILSNLVKCAELGHEIIVRIPLIPGITDGECLRETGRFLAKKGALKRVALLPYHRIAQEKYQRLGLTYTLSEISTPTPAELRKSVMELESFGLTVEIGG
ncbi:MAG: glycyl-radical enzyme activating protein [Anaerolineaceae bacterium]|nr:glycyl-radical enzyme activating protein [Anaerolineaceae bacterium]